MPNYDWTCLACDKTVAASLEACDGCGCPCDVSGEALAHRRRGDDQQRSDGSKRYLLLGIIGVPSLVALAWRSFGEQTVRLHLFRYGPRFEVSGPLSSLFGALAVLALAVMLAGFTAARFGQGKANLYRRIIIKAVLGYLVLMVLAIMIGWQFEHIRVAPGRFG